MRVCLHAQLNLTQLFSLLAFFFLSLAPQIKNKLNLKALASIEEQY
jgi:hypothetical protein